MIQTLYLKKKIKDSDGNDVKLLKFDFSKLTINDLINVDTLYFSITQGLEENILYKCTITFMHLCFFILCAKQNQKLSFSRFMEISGKDLKNITKIVENNMLTEHFIDKKKE